MAICSDSGKAVQGRPLITESKCPSAPVEWCRAKLGSGQARALVVNSGNANAFTGKKGRETVEITAKAAADAVGCAPDEIYVASTGVIGEPLDATKFDGVLDKLSTEASGEPPDRPCPGRSTVRTLKPWCAK